jgi:methionyl-tRNA synthetase
MADKHRDGTVPEGSRTDLHETADHVLAAYVDAMDAHLLHQGIDAARELTSAANGFVEKRAPWTLAGNEDDSEALDETLAALTWILAVLAALHHPFLPRKMEDLAGRLGLVEVPILTGLDDLDLAGRSVDRGEPLFPRADLAG